MERPRCFWKSPYTRWSVARKEARRKPRRPGQRLGAYRCRFCGAYHVGNLSIVRRDLREFHRRREIVMLKEMTERPANPGRGQATEDGA